MLQELCRQCNGVTPSIESKSCGITTYTCAVCGNIQDTTYDLDDDYEWMVEEWWIE